MGMHAKTRKQEYQNINRKDGTLDVILASKSACLGRYVDCTNKMNLNSTATHAERINPNSTHPPRNVQFCLLF